MPTAWNGSGVKAQTTSSTSARIASHVSGAAIGTATTMRAIAAIQAFAARELLALSRGDCFDHVTRNAEGSHQRVVEDPDTARGNGAHRHLLVTGNTKLAHDKHVERRAQGAPHHISNGYATARQGQDDDIRPVGVLGEVGCQTATRLDAVAKSALHGDHPFAYSSRCLISSQFSRRDAPPSFARTSANPPRIFFPLSTTAIFPRANRCAIGMSSTGSYVPLSHTITLPAP